MPDDIRDADAKIERLENLLEDVLARLQVLEQETARAREEREFVNYERELGERKKSR